MSRVGYKPIDVPNGVKISFEKNLMVVEGPKGKLQQDYRDNVTFEQKDNEVLVKRIDETKKSKAFHGLYRNLLNNMILGVTTGFQKVLLINGVGYRAEMADKMLVLNLGYSNQIEYQVPEGITVQIEGNNKLIISGIDKQQVGQISSEIRSLRQPEPYKGKGVKYEDEQIKRKVGKSGIK